MNIEKLLKKHKVNPTVITGNIAVIDGFSVDFQTKSVEFQRRTWQFNSHTKCLTFVKKSLFELAIGLIKNSNKTYRVYDDTIVVNERVFIPSQLSVDGDKFTSLEECMTAVCNAYCPI